jgi:hypothetical protein
MFNATIVSQIAGAVLSFAGSTTPADVPRYEEIVTAALTTAFQEAPLYSGESARVRTATLLLAIGQLESNYDPRVQSGKARGDNGQSWCWMQIHLPVSSRAVALDNGFFRYASRSSEDGWSGEELLEDSGRCFTVGLHIARMSMTRCKNLSLYTTGKCKSGERYAFNRERRGQLIWSRGKWKDSDVLTTGDVIGSL